MQWFLNLKIGTKLLAGFIFVAMIAGVIGYVGVSSLKSTAEAGTELFEKQTVPIVRMGKISTFFQRVRVNTRDIFLAATPAGANDCDNKIGSSK